MNYFYQVKDSHGYIHSVDNMVLTYYIRDVGTKAEQTFLQKLHEIKNSTLEINYWEKLDLNPSRKYSFYQNAIHLDDGIYILLGHYTDYQKDSKEFYVFPILRLEINPNKHAGKPVFEKLMALIRSCCYDCTLNRYDYAIDIPVVPNDVQVFGSNKEKGLYKGTRYFGQRNKNGFCRIYDKAKEQGLGEPLTRVEHVFSLTKATKNLSFEKIYIKNQKSLETEEKVSATDQVILDLCGLCLRNELDFEPILDQLDRRKKKKLQGLLLDCSFDLLELDMTVHDKLLGFYKKFFDVQEVPAERIELQEDEEGFLQVSDSIEIPFD